MNKCQFINQNTGVKCNRKAYDISEKLICNYQYLCYKHKPQVKRWLKDHWLNDNILEDD